MGAGGDDASSGVGTFEKKAGHRRPAFLRARDR
jgi:hypothetical protein